MSEDIAQALRRRYNTELSGRIDDTTLRIESMVYLACEAFGSSGSDAFEAFAEDPDHTAAELARMFGKPIVRGDDFQPYELLEALQVAERYGFLVQFATPVRKYAPAGRSYNFSWGHYRTQWFYRESLDDAIEAGIAWATQCHINDKSASACEPSPGTTPEVRPT